MVPHIVFITYYNDILTELILKNYERTNMDSTFRKFPMLLLMLPKKTKEDKQDQNK